MLDNLGGIGVLGPILGLVGSLVIAVVGMIRNGQQVKDCEKREERLYQEVQVYKEQVSRNNNLLIEYALFKRMQGGQAPE